MEAAQALSLARRIEAIKTSHAPAPAILFHEDAVGNDLVHATIGSQGSVGLGFGTGTTPEAALLKAYSEWIERGTFRQIAPSRGLHSTNGLAAHPDEPAAIANARLELIERDAFLTCWLAGRPPLWLTEREVLQVDSSGQLAFQCRAFAAKGFSLKLGVIGSSNGAVAVVSSLIAGEPLDIAGGVAIQTRADFSLLAALGGVVQTQRAVATVVLNRNRDGMPPLVVHPHALAQPRDLLPYFLNRANAVELGWYLEASEDAVAFPDCDIDVEVFRPSSAWPLTVARAYSHAMQDYFACEIPHEHLNWVRLRSVFPWVREVNERIHP
jgi:ribosomal protein S12 methylthiotransferase accessory factor YcaO